jgi:hypothetical protein
MKPLNRSRRARENAGLSVGQAARLLGVAVGQVKSAEKSDGAFEALGPTRLADLYGVSIDWLHGRSDLRDYAAVKQLDGEDKLLFADRDQLAELLASRPKRAGA